MQGGADATPRATNKMFLGIFVRMGQNGAEFGEVHPADEIKGKLVAVYDVYDHVREGDD